MSKKTGDEQSEANVLGCLRVVQIGFFLGIAGFIACLVWYNTRPASAEQPWERESTPWQREADAAFMDGRRHAQSGRAPMSESDLQSRGYDAKQREAYYNEYGRQKNESK